MRRRRGETGTTGRILSSGPDVGVDLLYMTQDRTTHARRRFTPFEAALLNKWKQDFSGTPVVYVMDGGNSTRAIRKLVLGDTDMEIDANPAEPQIRVVSLQKVLDCEKAHGSGPGYDNIDALNRAAKDVGKRGAILIEVRDTDEGMSETVQIGHP